MGVQQFLAKLSKASGRPMLDLTEYARIVIADEEPPSSPQPPPPAAAAAAAASSERQQQQRRRRRRLRIGVDISTWIHKASQGKGDMLADERHLDNYGRAELLARQQQRSSGRQGHEEGEQQQQIEREQQERIEREQREHLYIQACTKYVLDRLLRLQQGYTDGGGDHDDENSTSNSSSEPLLFSLLVVLDGSTPPIKRKQVKGRSDKRKEAIQQRDEAVVVVVGGSSAGEVVAAAAASDNEKGTNEEEALLQRRLKGFRRAGAGELFSDIVDCVIHAMRSHKICFLVAPYEADGQLAFLAQQGHIDLIVTEDSDLILASRCNNNINNVANHNHHNHHRTCPVLYKLLDTLQPSGSSSSSSNTSDNKLRGMLIRSEDWGSQKVNNVLVDGAAGREKKKSNNKPLDLTDFTPAMLAVVFVAAGCDYCDSLKGIGIVTACNIVREAFLNQKVTKKSSKHHHHHHHHHHHGMEAASPLSRVFAGIYAATWSPDKEKLTEEPGFKATFEHNFLGALLMFRHPTVYDPMLGHCRAMNLITKTDDCNSDDDDIGGDVELLLHKPYARLVRNTQERQAFVGSLITPPRLATYVAEGWISPRTFQLRSTYIVKSSGTAATNALSNKDGTTTSTSTSTSRTTQHLPESVHNWVEEHFPRALSSAATSSPQNKNAQGADDKPSNDNVLARAGAQQENEDDGEDEDIQEEEDGNNNDNNNFATQRQSRVVDSEMLSLSPAQVALPKRSLDSGHKNDGVVGDGRDGDGMDGTLAKRQRLDQQTDDEEAHNVEDIQEFETQNESIDI